MTVVRTRWPTWLPYLAAAWSLVYGALGFFWMLGAPGFPFGRSSDPSAILTPFPEAIPEVGGPAIAAPGAIGTGVGLTMARGVRHRVVSTTLLGFAWAVAVGLVLIIPDYRPLLGLAYTPIILIGAPFDIPPDVSLMDVLPWPVVNQLVCIGGGLIWAGAAVAYRRRMRHACAHCGRAEVPPSWTTPDAAKRWGTWATAVAIVVPVLYAVTRFAWALGIPFGITEEFLREGQEIGLWWAGAALATLAVGGALLTLGLVRPWGETFPRWMASLAGRRVPPWLAIIPAALVSLLVTSAGMMFVRLELSGALTDAFPFGDDLGWVALAPELLWPLWGLALAAATLAYHYRRRGRCQHCGKR